MTVSTSTSTANYTANGSTTTFAYPFKIFADSDLVVILRNTATAVETVQVLNSAYTVTGAGNVAGGNVVFGTAPASGNTVFIRRELPLTQETDFVPNDPFPAEAHENALDKLTMLVQQTSVDADRAIVFPETDSGLGLTNILPPAAARSNKVLGFKIDGGVTASTNTLAQFDAAVSSFVNATGNNAASILYDPAGSGALQTTVQEKLRERVSVKDFGAAGDGVTDDTAAIQAAIDACESGNFGKVYFPAGVYNVTQIKLPDFIRLEGSGFDDAFDTSIRPVTKIVGTDTTSTYTGLVVNKDETTVLTYAGISHMSFYTGSSATYDYTWDFKGLVACTFSNCRIGTGSNSVGGIRSTKVVGSPSWVQAFENVQVRLPDASTARSLYADFGDSRLYACSFTGGLGVLVFPTGGLDFIGCRFDRAVTGLTLGRQNFGNGHTTILGGQFEECSSVGILIDGDFDDAVTDDLFRPSITGCFFRNPVATYDIEFKNTTGVTLEGGQIYGCDFTLLPTIPIYWDDAAWNNLTITANQYDKNENNIDWSSKSNAEIIDRWGIDISGGHIRSRKASDTFTPTVDFVTTGDFSPTYSTQVGRGNVIGNRYFFTIFLTFTTNAYSTASGSFKIGGLPVTPIRKAAVTVGRLTNFTYISGDNQVGAQVATDGNVYLWRIRDGAASAQAGTGSIPPSTTITIEIDGWFEI